MLGKFEFYRFFHGLMISEKNINKSNIKWFTRSCSWICCSSVLTKKNLCSDRHLPCFLSLYLPRSCLVLVAYNKINIPCLFLFNVEIIHLQYVIFNSASRLWILITSGEKFPLLNKKACNICLLLHKAKVQ